MMKAGNSIFTLLFILLLTGIGGNLFGQEEAQLRLIKCARLETGFLYGGQIGQKINTWNPGGNFQYSYCIKTNKNIGAGLGGGIQLFDQEGFIPFYIDVLGFINRKKNSPFISGQGGYAFGWSKEFKEFLDVSFNPGFFIGAGIGLTITIANAFAGYASLAYRQQMASVSYLTESNKRTSRKINYGIFGLNVGIMLEQQ
jgi:hypothetical protein